MSLSHRTEFRDIGETTKYRTSVAGEFVNTRRNNPNQEQNQFLLLSRELGRTPCLPGSLDFAADGLLTQMLRRAIQTVKKRSFSSHDYRNAPEPPEFSRVSNRGTPA